MPRSETTPRQRARIHELLTEVDRPTVRVEDHVAQARARGVRPVFDPAVRYEKACGHCGNDFEPVERPQSAAYCSKACKDRARTRSKARPSNRKQKRRLEALVRWGTACSNCKRDGLEVEVHMPAVRPKSVDYALILCKDCVLVVDTYWSIDEQEQKRAPRRMSSIELRECIELERVYGKRGLPMPEYVPGSPSPYTTREVSLDHLLAVAGDRGFGRTRGKFVFDSSENRAPLDSEHDDYFWLGDPLDWLVFREEREERRARARVTLAAYDRGEVDPVEALIALARPPALDSEGQKAA